MRSVAETEPASWGRNPREAEGLAEPFGLILGGMSWCPLEERSLAEGRGRNSRGFLDAMAEASRSCRCEARSFCDSSHGQLRLLSSALKGITDAIGGGRRCYRRRTAVLPDLRGGASMGTAVLPPVGVNGGAAMAGSSAPVGQQWCC